MSDGTPPEDPFGGLPFMADLLKMFQGQGAGSMDNARRLAHTIANEGVSEPNVDPTARIEVEQLVRVAELQVAQTTGLPTGSLSVAAGTRSQWADRTISDYQPLFAEMTSSMADGVPAAPDLPDSDPMAPMMAAFSQMMGPMMLGMVTGSMVGHLAQRAFGGYDLPVPRPSDQPLVVSLPNVDAFGTDWSIELSDLRLWVCLHEVAHHAVLLVPHVRERLNGLLTRHASSFEANPESLTSQIQDLDLSAGPQAIAELQAKFNDPDAVLGAMRTPAQDAVQADLTALVAAITGYVDWTMDTIGANLIGNYDMVTEALRRRRVEADASDRFVERLLGLELDADQYDRGTKFVDGVIERAGAEGLSRLFQEPGHLPTPSEVDAPGLWLARIELDEPA